MQLLNVHLIELRVDVPVNNFSVISGHFVELVLSSDDKCREIKILFEYYLSIETMLNTLLKYLKEHLIIFHR